jgi:hypothetical protein
MIAGEQYDKFHMVQLWIEYSIYISKYLEIPGEKL